MKKLFSLFGFVAFLCPLLIAQPEVSSNNVQDEIRYLEQQWLDAAAVPDLPALRKMFSDDFMGTVYPQTSGVNPFVETNEIGTLAVFVS